jgi:hypothetical protein
MLTESEYPITGLDLRLPGGKVSGKHSPAFLCQYNYHLTQLFTKYKYIWRWLTMFRPLSGSSSGLYNELRKCSTCLKSKYIYTVLGKELCQTAIILIHRISSIHNGIDPNDSNLICRLYSQVLASITDKVDPRVIVRSERLSQLNKSK